MVKKKEKVAKKTENVCWYKTRDCKLLTVLFFMAIVLIAVVYFLDWLDYEKIEPQQVEKPVEVVVQSEENVVIDVVENSMDAVVSIAASQIEFRADEGIVDTVSNIGSGFIVDPSGVIITNQHVVSQQDIDYKVITNDGREYEVVQILQCSINDIALLKIEAEDLSVIPLGNSDNLKPGQLVIAIGTPLGEYAGSVTTGVVSGLNRSVTAGSQGFWGVARTYEDVIQISAAVNPGNSGGPLLNSLGEVIGVNFATTAGAENISFALPSNVVSRRFDEYRQYGKFLKPYLGIEYQMITENQAMFYDDLEPGVLVRRVVDGSPADEAGLQRLDVIVEVDGEPITQSFANIIQSYEIGQEMKMTVLREGEKIELVATLEEMDE
jgi:serine protease Do